MRIEQTIYVERESQRKIVLGKGGATIKAIGADARKEIAEHRRDAGASVSVREGARGLGRRSGALPAAWVWNFPAIDAESRLARMVRAMQWTDDGIVLGVKRHGEANAIVELMTRAHGRHLGLVRGGAGSRLRPVLQPGNSLRATWRARLDEHLGYYTVEGLKLRAGSFLSALACGLCGDASGGAGAAAAGTRSA